MKPLPPGHLTFEDMVAWQLVGLRTGWLSLYRWRLVTLQAAESDRRDAALMLEWRQLRGLTGPTFSASSVCGPCFGRLL